MSKTEWWQRGPVEGIPALVQPVAPILLQVRESVAELVAGVPPAAWNARPSGVAPVAFHVRHIAGVIDRLFTYARGEVLSETEQARLDSYYAMVEATYPLRTSEDELLRLEERNGRCVRAAEEEETTTLLRPTLFLSRQHFFRARLWCPASL